MSSIEAQQVLAQVSTLHAELDSGQAATGWAKKAASYKRKTIPYLTKGLLIYISEPASTTGTASVENTGTAAGQLPLQGSDSTMRGSAARKKIASKAHFLLLLLAKSISNPTCTWTWASKPAADPGFRSDLDFEVQLGSDFGL
jgi:hypothetical protein